MQFHLKGLQRSAELAKVILEGSGMAFGGLYTLSNMSEEGTETVVPKSHGCLSPQPIAVFRYDYLCCPQYEK